jgi:hypothetical protein
MGGGCLQSSASKCKRGNYEKMSQCHGKLGLGVRSRNFWNGRWWAHTRFCSAHCEGKYELERYNANAQQHRWYTFLYPSSPQS